MSRAVRLTNDLLMNNRSETFEELLRGILFGIKLCTLFDPDVTRSKVRANCLTINLCVRSSFVSP